MVLHSLGLLSGFRVAFSLYISRLTRWRSLACICKINSFFSEGLRMPSASSARSSNGSVLLWALSLLGRCCWSVGNEPNRRQAKGGERSREVAYCPFGATAQSCTTALLLTVIGSQTLQVCLSRLACVWSWIVNISGISVSVDPVSKLFRALNTTHMLVCTC